MTKLEKANNYIKENMHKVNSRPDYHFTPEIGWLNDPNGFSYFQDKYHLFYQFYPYDTRWNDMHWGHATSKDLISWEYEKVALANDTIADANGCFSGSAIEKDNILYLIYTGMINPNMGFKANPNEIIQHQCLAWSEDGVNFSKHKNNPIISQFELPKGYMKADFRDPKVIEKNGIYYVVLVAKNEEGRGDILFYKSLDLIKWDYVSIIYKSRYEENMMFECPDLFTLNGKEIIIFSGMPCNENFEEKVGNTTEYIIGSLDFDKGIFDVEYRDILDYGHSFYAPQSMEDNNNKRIVIGWMKKWVNKTITIPEEFGWNGLMSLPRVLTLSEGKLIQKPFESINNYFENMVNYKNINIDKKINFDEIKSTCAYINFEIVSSNNNAITLNLFEKNEKSIKISFDLSNNQVIYNSIYDNMLETYNLENYFINKDKVKIEVYLDKYTIEVFLNSGEKVFSFTNFTPNKGTEISLESKELSTLLSLKKCDIENSFLNFPK